MHIKFGGGAFYDCTALAGVYITDIAAWCNIDFEYYSNPLCYAQNLYLNGELVTDLVIPDGVTSIGSYAFEYCDSLTSVTIGNSVTEIGEYAFAYCSSLKYNEHDNAYYLGNESNPYVVLVKAKSTDITSCTINEKTKFIHSSAFSGCTSLTSIVIPDSVTSIGAWAFDYCTSLTSVTIGNGVTEIGGGAFEYCDSLTSATFENTSGWWYTNDSDATSGTSISSADLADPATAAQYLTDTYCWYNWKRS